MIVNKEERQTVFVCNQGGTAIIIVPAEYIQQGLFVF